MLDLNIPLQLGLMSCVLVLAVYRVETAISFSRWTAPRPPLTSLGNTGRTSPRQAINSGRGTLPTIISALGLCGSRSYPLTISFKAPTDALVIQHCYYLISHLDHSSDEWCDCTSINLQCSPTWSQCSLWTGPQPLALFHTPRPSQPSRRGCVHRNAPSSLRPPAHPSKRLQLLLHCWRHLTKVLALRAVLMCQSSDHGAEFVTMRRCYWRSTSRDGRYSAWRCGCCERWGEQHCFRVLEWLLWQTTGLAWWNLSSDSSRRKVFPCLHADLFRAQ